MPTIQEGALSYEAYINTDQFKRATREMRNNIDGVGDTAEREAKRMDAAFKKLSLAVAGYFTFEAAKQFTTQLVRIRGEFQQLNIALQTMLGSKEKADALMEQVKELAATTPFQLRDVATGAKQLLAYGFSVDTVAENLRKLGDLAAGVSAPLGDIVYLYGTMRTQGRAYAQDIRQFTNRGIPIIQKLADQFGVTTQEVNKLVSEGKVGFPQIEKAINSMTQEGGKFFNLMAKQSESLTGQISNLQDQFEFMLNDLGKSSEGMISGAIGLASELVSHYKEILKILGTIATAYGIYKAAVIATTVAERAHQAILFETRLAQKALTTEQALASIGLKTLQRAWRGLTLAMEANPIGIMAVALTAIVAGFELFLPKLKKTEDIVNDLNDATKDFALDMDKLINRYEELSKKANRTARENEELNSVMKKLATNVPSAATEVDKFGNVLNLNIDNVKEFNKALEEGNRLILEQTINTGEARLKTLEQQIEKYQSIINNRKITIAVAGPLGTTQFKEVAASDQEVIEATKNLQKYGKEYQELTGSINEAKNALNGAITLKLPADSPLNPDGTMKTAEAYKTIAERITDVNKQLREQQTILKQQRSSTSTATADEIQSTIDKITELQKKLKILQGETVKATVNKAVKTITPIPGIDGSFGTTFQKQIQEAEKSVQKEISDWIPQLEGMGVDVQDALNVVLSDPFNDSLGTVKSVIAAINKMLEDGFYLDKNNQKQIITPAQVETLKRARTQLEGLAKTGSGLWDQMRSLSGVFGNLSNDIGDIDQGMADVLSTAGDLVKRGADFLQSIRQTKDALNNVGGGIGNVISGISGALGAVGAVAGAVIGVVSSIINAKKKKEAELDRQRAEAIRRQNELFEKQLSIIQELNGLERVEKYGKTIEQITSDRNRKALEFAESFASIGARGADSWRAFGQTLLRFAQQGNWREYQAKLSEFMAKNQDVVSESQKAVADAILNDIKLVRELTNQLNEDVTGISFDSLTDQITDMFRQGELSAEDFANKFEDLMKTAVLRSFETKFIEEQMQKFYDAMAAAAKPGTEGGTIITKGEQDALKKMFLDFQEDSTERWEAIKSITGLDFDKENTPAGTGLAGQIKRSITEDTATELSGRINGMYLMTKKSSDTVSSLLSVQKAWQQKQMNQLQLSIRYLAGIESNTGQTAANTKKLGGIDQSLRSIDGKLSNGNDAKKAAGIK